MRWTPHHLLLTLLLTTCAGTGCASLPAGSLSAVSARPGSTTRSGQVYLLRGWRDLWSDGVDALGKSIAAGGLPAHVFKASQADDLGDALLREYRAASTPEPLVLVGFSFGADEAIRIARKFDEAKLPVALLVTIDPVTPPEIPANVRAARNFYQSNGALDVLPWLRGVPVRGAHADDPTSGRVTNIDVRTREDLLEPNTGHSTIAANAKLHRAIIEEVLRACPPRQVRQPQSVDRPAQ